MSHHRRPPDSRVFKVQRWFFCSLFLNWTKKKKKTGAFSSTKLMFRPPLWWNKSWIYFALRVPRATEPRGIFFSFDVLLFMYSVALFFFVLVMVVVCVLLCCPDILFGVCFAGCFVFNVTVIFPLQLPLSFAHIFHFIFRLSSSYCVPIFLYLVSMYLVFQFLLWNLVCAPFMTFGHVTFLLFVLLFFFFDTSTWHHSVLQS